MQRKLALLFVLSLFTCASGAAKDGIPHVVKRLNLYNQTGPIGPITLYTPEHHSGVFRVNTVMVITTGNGSQGYFCGEIGFTNKIGASQVPAMDADTSCLGVEYAGRTNAGTIPVIDETGSPLTFLVAGSDWQGAKYNIYIVVEEL